MVKGISRFGQYPGLYSPSQHLRRALCDRQHVIDGRRSGAETEHKGITVGALCERGGRSSPRCCLLFFCLPGIV